MSDRKEYRGRWNFSEFTYRSVTDPALGADISNVPVNTAEFLSQFGWKGGRLTTTYLARYLRERENLYNSHWFLDSYLRLQAALNTAYEEKHRDVHKTLVQASERLNTNFIRMFTSVTEDELSQLVRHPSLLSRRHNLLRAHRVALRKRPKDEAERIRLSEKETHLESMYTSMIDAMRIRDESGRKLRLTDAQHKLYTLPSRTDKKNLWERMQSAYTKRADRAALLLTNLTRIRTQQAHLEGMNPVDLKFEENDMTRDVFRAFTEATENTIPLRKNVRSLIAKYYGLRSLKPWDVLPETNLIKDISYPDAIQTIASAWGAIDPSLGRLILMMDRKGWIDISKGSKSSNRSACFLTPIHSFPRILFDGQIRSFDDLAHELGHAIYHYLLQHRRLYEGRFPNQLLNEMIALFSGKISSDELFKKRGISKDSDPMAIFGTHSGLIHNSMAAHQFETENFLHVSQGLPLSADNLTTRYWQAFNRWAGTRTRGADYGWIGTPHFFKYPLYYHQYAFGEALARVLTQLRQEHVSREKSQLFGDRLKAFMSASSSESPDVLFDQFFNLNITTPTFWRRAFTETERNVRRLTS